MRLIRVEIDNFKNLKDIAIDFDESSPYTVFVGENGAGKSNMIEALTMIFRDLDLDVPSTLAYRLEYKCRGCYIRIEAEEGRSPRISVKEPHDKSYRRLSKKSFMAVDSQDRPYFRPAFVFGYYSGPSDRLSELYDRHRDRFYTWIIRPRDQRAKDEQVDPNSLRRLFYAQTLHGQFALIAFFMSSDRSAEEDRLFLREHLQIEGLDSVLFALQEPHWTRKRGDPRFWNAEGEVADFLDRLYAEALMPMRMSRRVQTELTKYPLAECLYLFLPDEASLRRVYATYPDQYAFFTALESTDLSKLLSEVRTRVRLTPELGGGNVTYRDLSEGEQQLLLVLGLLKFTARDEALFLLDEPDTHLNPAWSTQYLGFLDRFIRTRERHDSCHIVMTSHDPLVFAGLTRSEVRIFRRSGEQGTVAVEVPDVDPRGMGVAAILTSDLFRLRTTLDLETQDDLDRQRVLAMSELTPETEAELAAVTAKLQSKGFMRTIRDPLYELFTRAWAKREDPSWREVVQLSPQQRQDREQLAAEIIEQLAREEREGRGAR
jgi:predicted ATPase